MKTVRPNLATVQALETGNVSIKPLPYFPTKTDPVKDLVQLNGRKEIITNEDGSTSQPGVFAAGEVRYALQAGGNLSWATSNSSSLSLKLSAEAEG